jgi:uncharacterized membrane protein YfcA
MSNLFTKKIPAKIMFPILVVCVILGVFLQEGITAGAVRKVVIGIFVASLIFRFIASVEKKPDSNISEETQNIENKKIKKRIFYYILAVVLFFAFVIAMILLFP